MLLDYEILENERLYKFTKNYAYDSQENQIVSSIRNFLGRSASDDTVSFIENTRASDISYLSNQISIANNSLPPIPVPVNNIGMLSRTVADFIHHKRGVTRIGGNPHNIAQYQRYQTYNTNLGIYNEALAEWAKIVSGYVNNLTNQKSLLESHSFI